MTDMPGTHVSVQEFVRDVYATVMNKDDESTNLLLELFNPARLKAYNDAKVRFKTKKIALFEGEITRHVQEIKDFRSISSVKVGYEEGV